MIELFDNNYNLVDKYIRDRLDKRNELITLTHLLPPFLITIGAPHQVPPGKVNICTLSNKPRLGDTNSGILGLGIFHFLKELDVPCKIVIKNRALYNDPNKDLNSDYSLEIFQDKTKLLFEIHGQSNRNNIPLEFSAGQNDLSKLSQLILFFYEEIRQLQKREVINNIYSFGMQEKPEKDDAILITEKGEIKIDKLILPALKSNTITEAEKRGIQAVHLETNPNFRFIKDKYRYNLTRDGINISKALSNSLYKYFYDPSFKDR